MHPDRSKAGRRPCRPDAKGRRRRSRHRRSAGAVCIRAVAPHGLISTFNSLPRECFAPSGTLHGKVMTSAAGSLLPPERYGIDSGLPRSKMLRQITARPTAVCDVTTAAASSPLSSIGTALVKNPPRAKRRRLQVAQPAAEASPSVAGGPGVGAASVAAGCCCSCCCCCSCRSCSSNCCCRC